MSDKMAEAVSTGFLGLAWISSAPDSEAALLAKYGRSSGYVRGASPQERSAADEKRLSDLAECLELERATEYAAKDRQGRVWAIQNPLCWPQDQQLGRLLRKKPRYLGREDEPRYKDKLWS